VTATKHDGEKILVGVPIRWDDGELLGVELDLAFASTHPAAPKHIAGAVLGHPKEPRCGVGRQAVGPRLERGHEGLLGNILGEIQVPHAEEAGEVSDEAP
jgi:hypothetical protein